MFYICRTGTFWRRDVTKSGMYILVSLSIIGKGCLKYFSKVWIRYLLGCKLIELGVWRDWRDRWGIWKN